MAVLSYLGELSLQWGQDLSGENVSNLKGKRSISG